MFRRSIATEAHRARLARLTTYVASAKALSTFSWKAYKTEHVVVDNVGADPLSNPAQLIIVGQVSHGVSYLGPVGNFNAQFDNMAKAKLTFELELPAESSFASDYFRAVAALRRLQKDVAKSSDVRNLLVDASTSSAVKFGAPLFRPKVINVVRCFVYLMLNVKFADSRRRRGMSARRRYCR